MIRSCIMRLMIKHWIKKLFCKPESVGQKFYTGKFISHSGLSGSGREAIFSNSYSPYSKIQLGTKNYLSNNKINTPAGPEVGLCTESCSHD